MTVRERGIFAARVEGHHPMQIARATVELQRLVDGENGPWFSGVKTLPRRVSDIISGAYQHNILGDELAHIRSVQIESEYAILKLYIDQDHALLTSHSGVMPGLAKATADLLDTLAARQSNSLLY